MKGGIIEHHIHFWLGSQTTPDKSGVAAYKTVELDNFLNGCCIQHRETEGNESSRFLSYFKNGLRYVELSLILTGDLSREATVAIKLNSSILYSSYFNSKIAAFIKVPGTKEYFCLSDSSC